MGLLALLILFLYITALVAILVLIQTSLPVVQRTIDASSPPTISIVIAFRNEAESLHYLLADLELQIQPKAISNIILIDDHSTDGSFAICQSFAHNSKLPLALLQNRGKAGKKAALKQGIAIATSDYILTTDADCRIPPTWFGTVAELVLNERPDLGILSLAMAPASSFFEQMQQQEFATIMATTAAMARARQPSMANGANLLFCRKLYLAYEASQIGQQIASGDDIFLLHYAKRVKSKIAYCDAMPVQVQTAPEATVARLVRQRLRWAGKWSSYADLGTIATAIGVWVIHLTHILFCLGIMGGALPAWFLVVVIAKGVLEYMIISKTLAKSGLVARWLPFLALQVCYSPYVVLTGLLSNFPSLYIWKGRTQQKKLKARKQ